MARIVIDESKMIGNSNKVYYMFGMFDRDTKNVQVYCILDNRNKETLLPIIEKNSYTVNDINFKWIWI